MTCRGFGTDNPTGTITKGSFGVYQDKGNLGTRMSTGVLAEAVRFELTEGANLRWFSRPVP